MIHIDVREGKTISSELLMRSEYYIHEKMSNALYRQALSFAKSWTKDEKKMTSAFVYANHKLFMQIIAKPDGSTTVIRL